MSLVLLFSVRVEKALLFLNLHSILIVILGTFAILCIATPPRDILQLVKSILKIGKEDFNDAEIKASIIQLSKNKLYPTKSKHPLIQYATSLWEQGTDENLLKVLLLQKTQQLQDDEERTLLAIKNLAKYPPALGMLGTVIGLVYMFSELTTNNKDQIGINLALAMTATFYGLLLANAILLPLADRLQIKFSKINQQNYEILETLLLIAEETPESFLEDKFNEQNTAA